jgi:hypothetical protein
MQLIVLSSCCLLRIMTANCDNSNLSLLLGLNPFAEATELAPGDTQTLGPDWMVVIIEPQEHPRRGTRALVVRIRRDRMLA